MTSLTWLKQQLEQPNITDVCINGTQTIFIDRGSGLELFSLPAENILHEEHLREWILAELSLIGKTWDAKYPFIDATLQNGYRLHVTFPPISPQGILISLRRLSCTPPRARWHDSPLYQRLVEAIQAGDSILISGATGSGKTTLINDLLSKIPPHERIIALEDTPELNPHHPHFLSLISRPPNADGYGEVTLRTLLRQTLRMRPDRIVLGECRGSEVLELLQALNTGHRGALATLHANSARDALKRIELLCLLSHAIPMHVIRELLALGIHWIAQIQIIQGKRKIHELWKLDGKEGDTLLLRPILMD